MVDASRNHLPLWRLRDVAFADGRLVVPSLEIPTGVVAVLGPTGAGKTSLLDLLVRFAKPARGSVDCQIDAQLDSPGDASVEAGVEVDGAFEVGDSMAGSRRRLPVYWAPQDGGLWPHLSAREHIRVVAADVGESAVDRWLALFDIAAAAHARPAMLSAGERDRLALARAIAADPAVLVLDEPLAHVDGPHREAGWAAIRTWLRRGFRSVVFATHEPRRVIAEATHVIGVEGGRIVYDGDVETLYHRPPSRSVATLLGEGNWFEADEAAAWIGVAGGVGPRASVFLRPEQLIVVRDPSGPLCAETVVFGGDVESIDVRHLELQQSRRLYHRPTRAAIRTGDRLRLAPLFALFLAWAVLLGGCGGDVEPVLRCHVVRVHPLPPADARTAGPRAVAFDLAGGFAALDTAGRVIRYAADGRVATLWSMPDVEDGRPEGLCFIREGELVVADTHYHRVLVFDEDGRVVRSFGHRGDESGAFRYPVGVTVDGGGDLYVCEYGGNDRVQRFDRTGRLRSSFGTFGPGGQQFQRPSGVAWHAGRVYVADAINNRIQVFSDRGEYLATWGEGLLDLPYDIAATPAGEFFVVEYGAGRVTQLDLEGRVVGRFGRPGTGRGEFRTPWGIAAAADGRILVADTGNRRIVELSRATKREDD